MTNVELNFVANDNIQKIASRCGCILTIIQMKSV